MEENIAARLSGKVKRVTFSPSEVMVLGSLILHQKMLSLCPTAIFVESGEKASPVT